MQTLIQNINYWLVEHPSISNFEWKHGVTTGSSLQFLGLTVVSYLTLTLFLSHSSFKPLSPSVIRYISAVHNLILLLLSFIMAVGSTLSVISQMPSPNWIVCFPANRTQPRGPTFFWAYIFYMSKILEYVDTLLIILSGSFRRLSFLHVYHHAVVLILCYLWLDNSQSAFPVGMVINASVHVVMYTYYFLCTLGIRPWWKRLVTDFQIIQFSCAYLAGFGTVYHHIFKFPCSGMSAFVFTGLFNTTLFLLFADFHFKNYGNDKQKKSHVIKNMICMLPYPVHAFLWPIRNKLE